MISGKTSQTMGTSVGTRKMSSLVCTTSSFQVPAVLKDLFSLFYKNYSPYLRGKALLPFLSSKQGTSFHVHPGDLKVEVQSVVLTVMLGLPDM